MTIVAERVFSKNSLSSWLYLWRVTPSPSGQAGPDLQLLGSAVNLEEARRYYPGIQEMKYEDILAIGRAP